MDLKQAYNYAVEHLNENAKTESERIYVLAVFQLGSRYAGYDVESSDYDFTVVYMPSAYDLLNREYGRSKIKFEHNDYEVEMSFMDIRKYLNRLLSSSLETLQMVFAPASMSYYAKFGDDNLSLRAEELVGFMLKLRDNRKSFVYLNTDKLYDSISGRAKSSMGNASISYTNDEYGRTIKYAIGVEYMQDLLQALYYNEDIREGLTVSPMQAPVYKEHRNNPSYEIARLYHSRAVNLIEKMVLNKEVVRETLRKLQPTAGMIRAVREVWTEEFVNIILGGYDD